MFNVIRTFFPSEQAWAFKWFFFVLFPITLSKELLQLVKVVITYGDLQEIHQLDEANLKFFPQYMSNLMHLAYH